MHVDAASVKSYVGSGTVCTDLTNINGNGTLTNGTTYDTTNKGVFILDGTDDIISFSHNAAQNPASIAISSWVNPSSPLQVGNIIGKSNNLGYRYRINASGSISLFDRGGTNSLQTATGLIGAGNWYNILVTGGAAGLQIFINGVLIISNATAFGGNTTTAKLAIGAAGDPASFSEYFKGSIAQISIYNRVLTVDEIQQNFNALRGRFGI
jgi:hypothetical protein